MRSDVRRVARLELEPIPGDEPQPARGALRPCEADSPWPEPFAGRLFERLIDIYDNRARDVAAQHRDGVTVRRPDQLVARISIAPVNQQPHKGAIAPVQPDVELRTVERRHFLAHRDEPAVGRRHFVKDAAGESEACAGGRDQREQSDRRQRRRQAPHKRTLT